MAYYPFSERKDTLVFTCTHILDGLSPVRLVTHHFDDGSWQFLCGEEGHGPADAVIITLGELLELDPELEKLSDLPVGCCAMRKDADAAWEYGKLADEKWYPSSATRMPD